MKEKYAKYLPHSGGRYAAKRFRKAQCPIVERLTNSMMMHGRNNGKKLMTVRIVKHAFEIIHLLTGEVCSYLFSIVMVLGLNKSTVGFIGFRVSTDPVFIFQKCFICCILRHTHGFLLSNMAYFLRKTMSIADYTIISFTKDNLSPLI